MFCFTRRMSKIVGGGAKVFVALQTNLLIISPKINGGRVTWSWLSRNWSKSNLSFNAFLHFILYSVL